MSGMFNKLYGIALIVLFVMVVLIIVGGIVVFIYLNQKKKRRSSKQIIDYSTFERKDTKEYIKDIDDIKDDMIILENGTRFAGVLDCQGFDFYSAQAVEQGNTVENYLGFVNTINKPITLRQYSVSVDMEDTIEMYMTAYQGVCDKQEKTSLKLSEMENALNSDSEMTQTRKELYQAEIEKAKKDVSAFDFRKFHIEDELRYIKNNSGVSTAPLITSTYVFDWAYNPMEFQVDLSDEEIIARAKAELLSIANSKIHALSMAGVKARRCTTNELIDMCRRNSSPISAERYKLRDVLRSSYFDDITSSNSPNEVKQYVRNTLDEEAAVALGKHFENMLEDDLTAKKEENLSAGSKEDQ